MQLCCLGDNYFLHAEISTDVKCMRKVLLHVKCMRKILLHKNACGHGSDEVGASKVFGVLS